MARTSRLFFVSCSMVALALCFESLSYWNRNFPSIFSLFAGRSYRIFLYLAPIHPPFLILTVSFFRWKNILRNCFFLCTLQTALPNRRDLKGIWLFLRELSDASVNSVKGVYLSNRGVYSYSFHCIFWLTFLQQAFRFIFFSFKHFLRYESN